MSRRNFDISSTKDTRRVARGARAKKGTIYQPILDRMAKLKPGKSFTIAVPKGVTARTYHNRLNATFRRFPPVEPEGCYFYKFTTEDGRICIACEEYE